MWRPPHSSNKPLQSVIVCIPMRSCRRRCCALQLVQHTVWICCMAFGIKWALDHFYLSIYLSSSMSIVTVRTPKGTSCAFHVRYKNAHECVHNNDKCVCRPYNSHLCLISICVLVRVRVCVCMCVQTDTRLTINTSHRWESGDEEEKIGRRRSERKKKWNAHTDKRTQTVCRKKTYEELTTGTNNSNNNKQQPQQFETGWAWLAGSVRTWLKFPWEKRTDVTWISRILLL